MILAIEKLSEECDLDETHNDNEAEGTSELDDSIKLAFAHHSEFKPMSHMRCAAHTLQLAIRDGLKVRHVSALVSKIRQVVVAARAPKTDGILRRKTNKGAILDQATKWGSTYTMLERLLELKPALLDIAHPDASMSEAQWNHVKDLEALLRHPFLTTKKLQAADLTPGAFFKEWKKLLFKFFQTGSMLADAIKPFMERREKVLFPNDVLLAAVYVDPTYRVTLNDEGLAKGKSDLFEIALAMKDYEENSVRPRSNLFEEGSQNSTPENLSAASEDFEKLLDRESKRRKTETPPAAPLCPFKADFNNALTDLEQIDRSSKVTVVNAIPLYPTILQNVSYAVAALSPTQVSVERLFSALRIITSDLRISMKEDLLEATSFFRTNGL